MTAETLQPGGPGESRRADGLRALATGYPSGTATGTLTAGGRRLRVTVRSGNPKWPPLVLCNGIGARLELLEPFVSALSPEREVVRFDMPGVGGSQPPVVPYHLATLAPLMSDLLDQLGYQQADFLGVSWGGALAQHFAVLRPERVRRLVLVATSPGGLMVPGHPRALLRMLWPWRNRDHGLAASIAGELYGGSVRDDPALARELLRATTHLIGTRGYSYQVLAIVGWTSLPLLPLMRQPTLILAGDDDPIIPAVNARVMHRLIPRSELTIYRGGHLDLITEAGHLAPVVEAFLTDGDRTALNGTGPRAALPPRRAFGLARRLRRVAGRVRSRRWEPAAAGAAPETAGRGRPGAGPAGPCSRRRAPRSD
jgi:poly(3-hydroxyalkanoate) depolymerase